MARIGEGEARARNLSMVEDHGDGTASLVASVTNTPGSTVIAEPVSGALTDRSGSITVTNVSQQLAPANSTRKYLLIQNVSGSDLWVNFGADANAAQPSIKLKPDERLVFDGGFVPTQAINILGGALTQTWAAKEGS